MPVYSKSSHTTAQLPDHLTALVVRRGSRKEYI